MTWRQGTQAGLLMSSDNISGDNWEVGEKFLFFLRGVEIMFDNDCREYS